MIAVEFIRPFHFLFGRYHFLFGRYHFLFGRYHFATHIRLKGLGNADSLGSLEIFEQSSYDARQRQGGTVERMAESGLARFSTAIAT